MCFKKSTLKPSDQLARYNIYAHEVKECSVYNSCAKQEKKCNARLNSTENTQLLSTKIETNKGSSENIEDELLNDIHDLEELVANKFQNREEEDRHAEFSVMVELKREPEEEEMALLEINQHNKNKKFHTIISTLLEPLCI
ncbi:1773_t:CDS:2, partial [Racocetra fulgida]